MFSYFYLEYNFQYFSKITLYIVEIGYFCPKGCKYIF